MEGRVVARFSTPPYYRVGMDVRVLSQAALVLVLVAVQPDCARSQVVEEDLGGVEGSWAPEPEPMVG